MANETMVINTMTNTFCCLLDQLTNISDLLITMLSEQKREEETINPEGDMAMFPADEEFAKKNLIPALKEAGISASFKYYEVEGGYIPVVCVENKDREFAKGVLAGLYEQGMELDELRRTLDKEAAESMERPQAVSLMKLDAGKVIAGDTDYFSFALKHLTHGKCSIEERDGNLLAGVGERDEGYLKTALLLSDYAGQFSFRKEEFRREEFYMEQRKSAAALFMNGEAFCIAEPDDRTFLSYDPKKEQLTIERDGQVTRLSVLNTSKSSLNDAIMDEIASVRHPILVSGKESAREEAEQTAKENRLSPEPEELVERERIKTIARLLVQDLNENADGPKEAVREAMEFLEDIPERFPEEKDVLETAIRNAEEEARDFLSDASAIEEIEVQENRFPENVIQREGNREDR